MLPDRRPGRRAIGAGGAAGGAGATPDAGGAAGGRAIGATSFAGTPRA